MSWDNAVFHGRSFDVVPNRGGGRQKILSAPPACRMNFVSGIRNTGETSTKEAPVSSQSTRGRKPKGNRVPISGKIPVTLKPILEDAADDMGLPLTDYVAIVLAEYHGQPEPTYVTKTETTDQEALPIGA